MSLTGPGPGFRGEGGRPSPKGAMCMPGVEIAESKENQKDPVEWEVGAGPQPAQQQRYGPAASRGAYHRAAPRTCCCNCAQLCCQATNSSRLGRIVDFDL